MDPKPAQVTEDKSSYFSSFCIKSNENILSMGFKGDSILDEGRDESFARDPNISGL